MDRLKREYVALEAAGLDDLHSNMDGLKLPIESAGRKRFHPLHSNMDGLKLSVLIDRNSPLINFTFQYGRIKTRSASARFAAGTAFTFQYGRIKTGAARPCARRFKHLYIPIWTD